MDLVIEGGGIGRPVLGGRVADGDARITVVEEKRHAGLAWRHIVSEHKTASAGDVVTVVCASWRKM